VTSKVAEPSPRSKTSSHWLISTSRFELPPSGLSSVIVCEVCAEYKNPAGIITKGALIERDVDVLIALHERADLWVTISIPFWDRAKARAIEPYVVTPERRLRIIEKVAAAGIHVGVNVAPMIPGLNDEDIPRILTAAKNAGASYAGFVFLRLPGSVKDVFEVEPVDWLLPQERIREAMPLRADRIFALVRDARGGKLYDPRWEKRQEGEGAYAASARALFEQTARRLGLQTSESDRDTGADSGGEKQGTEDRTSTFERPAKLKAQLELL
jgi:DNA repair photolyase